MFHIVDGDSARRLDLAKMLRKRGLKTEAFGNGDDIFVAFDYLAPGTVLVVGGWPAETGLGLLLRLKEKRPEMVYVLMDDDPEIPYVVQALRSGAADFIALPYHDDDLLAALRRTASDLPMRITHQERMDKALELAETLTPRERQVLRLVGLGETSRAIADALDISTRTVELHRANIMSKFGARNIAVLMRLAIEIDQFLDPDGEERLLN